MGKGSAGRGWPIVAGALAAMLAAVAAAGCSPSDDGTLWDGGVCDPASCNASCRAAGHGGGSCAGTTTCICDGGGDGGDYSPWDIPADTVGMTTRMRGKVWSPGGVVPISGALVYFAFSDPTPIPSGAYPETCEDPPTPFFVLSDPDGSWELDVLPGTYRLVSQKGQFRRIRDITVPDGGGPIDVDYELTTLPSRNGDGDTIPHIALVWALEGGDHIEDVLAKLQMGTVGGDNRLVRGSEVFDIYNTSGYEPNTALLEDLERMLSYHILFFPCTVWFGYDGEQLNDPTGPLSNPAVLENLRSFANAGGKIYATDMMYDVFERPMPDYVDICGDDAVMNAGDEEAWAHTETMSGWTSHGQSIDPDLTAWLEAIGVPPTSIDFRQNFVWIEGLLDILDPSPTDPIPPKIWVTGDFALDRGRTLPLTVTWPYGAGKVMFSTYHTVGDPGGSVGHTGIYPQEYVLVYLIMEIGVCQDPFF